MTTTTTPVTTSGWYELDNGQVQRFDWRNGRLVSGNTVDSWADVPESPSWDDAGYTRKYVR
jgi:hypothetical protein